MLYGVYEMLNYIFDENVLILIFLENALRHELNLIFMKK